MSQPFRLLLVDDHPFIREGVRASLSGASDLEVIGEAGDGAEAISQVEKLRPDAVVMDVNMKGMDGLEATKILHKRFPQVKVILFTVKASEDFMRQAIRAGAAGYVLKGAPTKLLLHSLRTTLSGGNVFPPHLMREALSKAKPHPSAEIESLTEPLTEREQAVLKLLAAGYKNHEIGQQLGLATITVKKHVQSLMAKMQANDRTHVAVKAYRLGLVD